MLSGQMNFIAHNYISRFENRTEKQSDDINVFACEQMVVFATSSLLRYWCSSTNLRLVPVRNDVTRAFQWTWKSEWLQRHLHPQLQCSTNPANLVKIDMVDFLTIGLTEIVKKETAAEHKPTFRCAAGELTRYRSVSCLSNSTLYDRRYDTTIRAFLSKRCWLMLV